MPVSEDGRRRVIERMMDTPAAVIGLAELAYPQGAWIPSVEVWVNGALRMPGLDFTATPQWVFMQEPLEEGDTIRISALPSLATPPAPA